MKQEIYDELIRQGTSQIVANGVIRMLQDEKQEKEMMNYLVSIRDIMVPAEQVLLKANKIAHRKDK